MALEDAKCFTLKDMFIESFTESYIDYVGVKGIKDTTPPPKKK